jgi:hypothetical protein
VIVVDSNDSSREGSGDNGAARHIYVDAKVQSFIAPTKVRALPQIRAVLEVSSKRGAYAVFRVQFPHERVAVRGFGEARRIGIWGSILGEDSASLLVEVEIGNGLISKLR